MEVNTIAAASAGPIGLAAENQTHKHHHSHSQLYSHHHHHGIFPSKSVLIIIMSTISVMVLLAIIFIVLMLRRVVKSTKNNGNIYKESSIMNNTSSRFIAQTTVAFNSSPGNKKYPSCVSFSSLLGCIFVIKDIILNKSIELSGRCEGWVPPRRELWKVN